MSMNHTIDAFRFTSGFTKLYDFSLAFGSPSSISSASPAGYIHLSTGQHLKLIDESLYHTPEDARRVGTFQA